MAILPINSPLKSALTLAGIVVLSGFGGYLIGVRQNDVSLPKLNHSLVVDSDVNASLDSDSVDIPTNKNSVKSKPHAENTEPPEGSFEVRFNQNVESMNSGLQSLATLTNSGDIKGAAEVKQQLMMLASKDSEALSEMLNYFRMNIENEEVTDQLMQVMGNIKDPQVENLAQDLALQGDRESQVKGLELLGTLDLPSEQTLDIAVSALDSNSDDPEMLQVAMHAIPKMSISSERNEQVLSKLSELSKNEDESVRSASLFLISQQAKTGEQFAPVFDALESETIDDRISAAMAIEQSHVVSAELKNVLLQKVADSKELPEVRAMAANSLNRFSLSAEELSSVDDYRAQQRWNAAN